MDVVREQRLTEEGPYLVSWNLTGRCNLSCPHCYMDSGRKSFITELTTEEIRLGIHGLSNLNRPMMLILSGGEPMLRKDIFEIVEDSNRAGLITVLGSNGTLLTLENLKLLKGAGLNGVGISIDSCDRSYHDSFRGLDGAWELSMEALRTSREIGIETLMDVTLTDQNWMEIDNLVETGASIGVKAIHFFFLICTGRAMKTSISMKNYGMALKHIADVSIRERRLMVRARCAPHVYRILHEAEHFIPQGTRGCPAGRSYIRIDPEGYVTPCPYMDLPIGNIREELLSILWEKSPVLRSLRTGNYKGRCGLCEYREICGGCRARAFAEKGDYMEEDFLCDYFPRGGEMVRPQESFKGQLAWTPEAKEKVRKAPFFIQSMIVKMVEARARGKGIDLITPTFLDEIKAQTGIHPK